MCCAWGAEGGKIKLKVNKKRVILKDIFPGLVLEFSRKKSRTFHDLPGGVGNPVNSFVISGMTIVIVCLLVFPVIGWTNCRLFLMLLVGFSVVWKSSTTSCTSYGINFNGSWFNNGFSSNCDFLPISQFMGWHHPTSQSSVGLCHQLMPDAAHVLPLEETSSFHSPLRNLANIPSVLPPVLLGISFHGTFETCSPCVRSKNLSKHFETMDSSHRHLRQCVRAVVMTLPCYGALEIAVIIVIIARHHSRPFNDRPLCCSDSSRIYRI